MKDVVIVSGARIAVSSFVGSLNGVGAADLGALVIRQAIRRAGFRPDVSAAVRTCRPCVFRDAEKIEIQKKHYDYSDTAVPVFWVVPTRIHLYRGRPTPLTLDATLATFVASTGNVRASYHVSFRSPGTSCWPERLLKREGCPYSPDIGQSTAQSGGIKLDYA